MTLLVHKAYIFTYLLSFGGLIGASWCSCAVISLGANSSSFLTQIIISFGHFINQISYYGMIVPQSLYYNIHNSWVLIVTIHMICSRLDFQDVSEQ